MDVNEDAQRLLVEINQLEEELSRDGRNLENILKMTELYLRLARPDKAVPYLNQAFDIFKSSHRDMPVSLGLEVVTVSIKYWKYTRYENKTKINASAERNNVMNEIWNVLLQLSKDTQAKIASNGVDAEDNQSNINNSQVISCKMAYMKECMGNNSDALAILSDLIASHAVEAVDLSYVILKAAIILKHIGQNKQSIEYLEFLLDDPPVQEGYTKLHIVAFLILLYENSGEKYKVFLHQKYKDLKAAYAEDLTNKKVSTANNLKKLNDIIKSPVLATSSEIWEIFAMQALEKCEYIMAVELLQQAVIKAPTKGKLFLVIAEIYNLLKKPEQALKYCEKAAVLIPSNEDCRNMLLMLNPDKYTEKLRTAAVINVAVKNKESVGASEDFDDGTAAAGGGGESGGHHGKESGGGGSAGGGGEEPANWIDKVKSKATGTLKAISENGVAATILAPVIPASGATAKGGVSATPAATGTAGKNKKSGAVSNKKATVTRGKQTQPKAVVAKPVPQEEVQEEQVDQGNKYRPKKPVLDEEAQRMLKLILSGNQNIHFYDASMKALADIRAPPTTEEEAVDM